MADPVLTDEEIQVLALVKQIGIAIKVSNEVPTPEEVHTSIALIPNIAGGYVQNKTEFDLAVGNFLLDNPIEGKTDEEIVQLFTGYLNTNKEVPTQSEVDIALGLDVHNEQTALNFTVEQIQTIVEQYNIENPLAQRSVEEIEAIITTYNSTANQLPSLDEINNSLNLEVASQTVTINYTDEQITAMIAQWVEDNPQALDSSEVGALIQAYVNVNNLVPTVEEVVNSLGLNSELVTPKSIFNVRTPMVKSFDDVYEAILNKIQSVNLSLPNPPAKDIKYVLNKTVPRFYSTWVANPAKDIEVSSQNSQYVEDMDLMYSIVGDDIQVHAVSTKALLYTLALPADKLVVTIDAKRLFILKTGVVKVYDKNEDGLYTLFQTIDETTFTTLHITAVGDRLTLLDGDSHIHTYILDRNQGLFTLHSNFVHEVEIASDMTIDGLTYTYITSDKVVKRLLYDEVDGWGAVNTLPLKKEVNEVQEDYVLSNEYSFIVASLDLARIILYDTTAGKLILFHKIEHNIFSYEEDIAVTVTGLSTSYDLSHLYFNTTTNIVVYEAQEYI